MSYFIAEGWAQNGIGKEYDLRFGVILEEVCTV